MKWPYAKRSDGKIAVVIDNCAWDFFYAKGIDLADELPSESFLLFILRQGEIEKDAIPRTDGNKEIIEYIEQTMIRCNVQVASTYGYFISTQKIQRYGSWNQGTFESPTEHMLRYELLKTYVVGNKETGSGLVTDEADLALAVQSAFGIVLTSERPTKEGPLQYASQRGGKVLYLRSLEAGASLKANIMALHEKG